MLINLHLPRCPSPGSPPVNSRSPLLSLIALSLECLRLGGGRLTAHGVLCLAGCQLLHVAFDAGQTHVIPQ